MYSQYFKIMTKEFPESRYKLEKKVTAETDSLVPLDINEQDIVEVEPKKGMSSMPTDECLGKFFEKNATKKPENAKIETQVTPSRTDSRQIGDRNNECTLPDVVEAIASWS